MLLLSILDLILSVYVRSCDTIFFTKFYDIEIISGTRTRQFDFFKMRDATTFLNHNIKLFNSDDINDLKLYLE